eukprot:TRINITY_DN3530_c4_g1_i1.p1 TRINITY_DN3530_c4_g1~~TRINITY_DN3530_c4_g1_i1.p1  ORF type:complete len:112 (+),score=8.06 TRINITY_DN3530_c4_g1_i1:19-354(+)
MEEIASSHRAVEQCTASLAATSSEVQIAANETRHELSNGNANHIVFRLELRQDFRLALSFSEPRAAHAATQLQSSPSSQKDTATDDNGADHGMEQTENTTQHSRRKSVYPV